MKTQNPKISAPSTGTLADSKRVCRSAFTLVELLVVIVIIALLASLILLSITKVRTMARGAHSANNLRMIGSSLIMYSADHDGKLPVGIGAIGDYPIPGGTPNIQGLVFWDDQLMLKGYLTIETLRCPVAESLGVYNRMTPLRSRLPTPHGSWMLGWSNRQYAYNTFLAFPATDGAFIRTTSISRAFRISQIARPSSLIAVATGDTSEFVNEGIISGGRNVWLVGSKSAAGNAVPGIRINGGGHYLYLDGHVSYHKPDAINTTDNPQLAHLFDPRE